LENKKLSGRLYFWAKKAPKSIKIKNDVNFLQFGVNFQCLITYFCKIFKKSRKYSLRRPDIKKKKN